MKSINNSNGRSGACRLPGTWCDGEMKTSHISGRTHAADLDRHEGQFSLLVSVAFIIMAGGMVLLMYPVVFSGDDFPGKHTLRVAFFGFVALSALFVLYFRERQRTIGKWREQLLNELQRHIEIERQASVELLKTLPDLSHFQDGLAMEFRRAANSDEALSVIIVTLKTSGGTWDKNETLVSFSDAAKAMSRRLRVEDSIYHLDSGHFGILLPNTDTGSANECASQLKKGLQNTAGVAGRFVFDLMVLSYPEHVGSAHGLYEMVCNLLPNRQNRRDFDSWTK
jgi:GGDEF domain-containing protein